MENPEPDNIKVVFVGNSSVGKTSIIHRGSGEPMREYGATVNGQFLQLKGTGVAGPVQLCLWDTAGQERYKSMMPIFFRNAHLVFLVFDLSQPESLRGLFSWNELVLQNCPTNVVRGLICNKCDLESAVQQTEIDSVGRKLGCARTFVTSALTGQGIDDVFAWAMNDPTIPRDRPPDAQLQRAAPHNEEAKGKCSC